MNITRPRFWRILLVCAVLISLFQIGAALSVLQIPDDVTARISLLLPLEFVASGLWAAAFAWVAGGLVRNHRRALRYTVGALVGFAGYTTLHRMIFSRADYERGRLPFFVAVIIITIGITMIALVFPRRAHSTIRENASDGSKS